jgi:DNA helicase II / ATP-dependent DNA helicase PcrA
MDLTHLNEPQLAAVETMDGPMLVLAGAGSGKTRVLTWRIARLLESGACKPWQILALTFTNKAAGEMKERVRQLIGAAADELWIGTFHSVFAKILRREIEVLGYRRNFVIYDADDQLKLIKSVMLELGLDPKEIKPKMIRNRITDAKNSDQSPEQFAEKNNSHIDETIHRIYSHYEQQLKQNNALDFDDLLTKPLQLFRTVPDRLQFYQERFRYILIDEYQDTNRVQYQVIHQLADRYRNICVVGDDDQSIYSWRGADIRNILEFERDYPGCPVFKLEQNYRSTGNILKTAQAVIEKNSHRHPKKLWTSNDDGEQVVITVARDELDEGRRIYEQIRRSKGEGIPLREMAILYRTNAQSRALEDVMRSNDIPYSIVGGTRFYERREIKDLLAYLKLLVNPPDDVAFRRVINYPRRGIGAATLQLLEEAARERKLPLTGVIREQEVLVTLRAAVRNRLQDFNLLLDTLQDMKNDTPPGELLQELIDEIDLMEELRREGPEGEDRIANVQELKAALDDFHEETRETLQDFLEQSSLMSDVDRWEDAEDRIVMMTAHSAKGLEFDTVFISGLEEGLFPIQRLDDPQAAEEERRLFYVAVTRARRRLFLLRARSRRLWSGRQLSYASSFLSGLPQETVQGGYMPAEEDISDRMRRLRQETAGGGHQARRKTADQSRPAEILDYDDGNQELENIRVGVWVRHPTFGLGKVLQISGMGSSARIKVRFENSVKKLVAGYAHLSVIEE